MIAPDRHSHLLNELGFCLSRYRQLQLKLVLFAVLVAEGASRLRRMPMSALPPKLPPGLDLPEGAISSEFARRLRLGDYMIRLDSSCIHTSLQAREHALEFARIALRGESPKIQFVSTEKVSNLPQNV